jgi:hypothetical protein
MGFQRSIEDSCASIEGYYANFGRRRYEPFAAGQGADFSPCAVAKSDHVASDQIKMRALIPNARIAVVEGPGHEI